MLRRDEVDHACRHAGLTQHLDEGNRGQRGGGGWLDDRGVAGGERRADLARSHSQREVPRGHQIAGANRIVRDQPLAAVRQMEGASVGAHCLFGEPLEESGAIVDLAEGFLVGLAHLAGHEFGEDGLVVHHRLVGGFEHRAAFDRAGGGPCFSGGGRRVEGARGILGGSVAHGEQRLASGGVVDVECGAGGRGLPTAVDEQGVAGLREQIGNGIGPSHDGVPYFVVMKNKRAGGGGGNKVGWRSTFRRPVM